MIFDEEPLQQTEFPEAETTNNETEPQIDAQESAPTPTDTEVEETAPAAKVETANVGMETPEFSMAQDAYEQSFKRLQRGQLVEGTVVQVDKDVVLVDVGTKSEGIIPLQELSTSPLTSTDGTVSVGDKIMVVVLQPENQDGNPVLSKRRAEFSDAWDNIETALREDKTISAMVIDRVKGGLVVDVGVRGFVPATHVGNGKLRNIEIFVGQSLPLKVLEIDRERRKVVLSNKKAEDENRESRKTEVFGRIKPGMIMDGTVRRLVDYGVFVDLKGVDGLLHISEMSWTRISHPSEMVKEGDQIKVQVLRIDPDAGKVSLGLRQVMPDPWSLVGDNYIQGQTVEFPVSRIVQSGAFVKLPEGVEAFIPVSEMAHRRVNKPGDVVTEGQNVKAQIVEVRPQERRIVLSIKALEEKVEREDVQRNTPKPQAGGATIGERLSGLSALRGLLNEGDTNTAKPAEAAAPEAEKAEKAEKAPEVEAETASAESAPVESAAEEIASEPTMAETSEAPVVESIDQETGSAEEPEKTQERSDEAENKAEPAVEKSSADHKGEEKVETSVSEEKPE